MATLAERLSKKMAQFKRMVMHSVAVSCVLVLSACTQEVNLQTGLKDADANEIVTLLHRSGIDAQKVPMKDGITVKVKDTDIARATDAMQKAGLPRRRLENLGNVFKKEGMISTPMEERIRYIHGLSQELEFTLQQIDNVVTARVHVVLPERVAPGEPIMPSSAAVFVKHHMPFDEDVMLPRIRRLVASSIPGLSGDNENEKVSIVLTPALDAEKFIEWERVGPFMVQEESASALRATLGIMISVIVLAFLEKLWKFLLQRFPGLQILHQKIVLKVTGLIRRRKPA